MTAEVHRFPSVSPPRASPATPPEHRVTMIECDDDHRFVKTFLADGSKKDYDHVAKVRAHEFVAEDLQGVARLLSWASTQPRYCLIRGAPKPDTPTGPGTGGWVPRRMHGDTAAFDDRPTPIVVFDFDETTAAFDLADPEESVRRWHDTLPDDLRLAGGVFCLSASAHASPTVRGKLVVLYDRPIDTPTAKALASRHGAGPSVAVPVQPNYLAAPIFHSSDDPLEGHRAPIVFNGPPAKAPVTRSGYEGIPDDDDAEAAAGRSACRRVLRRVTRSMVDGQRNKITYAVGGYLRNAGVDKDAIDDLLVSAAEAVGFDTAEARRTLDSVFQADHPKGADGLRELGETALLRALDRNFPRPDPKRDELTAKGLSTEEVELGRSDWANSVLLADYLDGRALYCSDRQRWLTWDGRRWTDDTIDAGVVTRMAGELFQSIQDLSDGKDRIRLAGALSQSRIKGALTLCRAHEGMSAGTNGLDADPYLLNVRNGTLDLKTLDLRPHRPEDHITKIADVDFIPGARSDLWDASIRRWTGGDEGLSGYVQRALGSCLIGKLIDKKFQFVHGPANGGKSALLITVGTVLGDYHRASASSTWMVQSVSGGNRGDITRLRGARLVTVDEVRPDARFDEQLVKQWTGGAKIVAAAKYEGEIEFDPTAKLWMSGNDRPAIRSEDTGMWARVDPIPITAVIPEGERIERIDTILSSDDHAPAVLAWLVEGLVAYQQEGLGGCPEMDNAREDYRREVNSLAAYAYECLEITGDAADEIPTMILRDHYVDWCGTRRTRPLIGKAFGTALRDLGVGGGGNATRHQTNGTRDRHWTGVKFTS